MNSLQIDPQIKDLMAKLGIEAAKQTMQAVIRAWEERKKKKLSAAEKSEISKVTASMIQMATMDDIREFSPVYRHISVVPKKGSAAKRVSRKVVVKCKPTAVPPKPATHARKPALVKKSAANKR